MSLHEPTADEALLRPTHVQVDLPQIQRNYQAIVKHVGRPVMPIVKANAYGHGLVAVSQALEAEGAPMLGLAYLEEGVALRRAGIRIPILVLGGILGDQIPQFLAHDLMLTASSVDKLAAVDAAATAAGVRAKVHLKIDTGMERIGVHWYNADKLLAASLQCNRVDVVGIFSHLAQSDELDDTYTKLQTERFLEVCAFFERRSLPSPMRHLANSAAVIAHPDTWLDLVRPGILLFGVVPSEHLAGRVAVAPALRWKSRVVYFKVVPAGHPVSYGSTWAPAQQTRIVTVPVGYGDGYPRALSNQGAMVLIGGKPYPVVGRVCMDQVMVDIGWDSAYNGDEVVMLGGQGDERITAETLAEKAGTIPYEILTGINTRVPRVYSTSS